MNRTDALKWLCQYVTKWPMSYGAAQNYTVNNWVFSNEHYTGIPFFYNTMDSSIEVITKSDWVNAMIPPESKTATCKIYIAGPVTGIGDEWRKPFNKREAELLKTKGNIVMNPAWFPVGLTENCYMEICFALIRECNKIEVLPGWESSLGTKAEIAYANKLDIPIYYVC